MVLIRATATDWQSEVAREVTIQVRPAPGRDIEADVKAAAAVAAAQPGVAGVRPYSKAETARLLEPWLGTGLSFDDLPVPRLIVVQIASDGAPDLGQLAQAVGAQVHFAQGWNLEVPNRAWSKRQLSDLHTVHDVARRHPVEKRRRSER